MNDPYITIARAIFYQAYLDLHSHHVYTKADAVLWMRDDGLAWGGLLDFPNGMMCEARAIVEADDRLIEGRLK